MSSCHLSGNISDTGQLRLLEWMIWYFTLTYQHIDTTICEPNRISLASYLDPIVFSQCRTFLCVFWLNLSSEEHQKYKSHLIQQNWKVFFLSLTLMFNLHKQKKNDLSHQTGWLIDFETKKCGYFHKILFFVDYIVQSTTHLFL